LPEELGKAATLLADTGYFSEANVQACAAAGIDPLIAMGRQSHHQSLAERFAPASGRALRPGAGAAGQPDAGRGDGASPEDARRQEALWLTQADAGAYAGRCRGLRKRMPEPVFGIIKSALGFRQFLLRGLDNVRGEWSLVTMAWNMKRMFALGGAI